MIYRVTTRSGSVYKIDETAHRWSRITTTDESGGLRTEDGDFGEVNEVEVGKPMMIMCPPIVEHANCRVIYTSPVIKVEFEKE